MVSKFGSLNTKCILLPAYISTNIYSFSYQVRGIHRYLRKCMRGTRPLYVVQDVGAGNAGEHAGTLVPASCTQVQNLFPCV